MNSERALQLAVKAFCSDREKQTSVKTHPVYMFSYTAVLKDIEKSIALKMGVSDAYQIKEELFFTYTVSTAEDFFSNVNIRQNFPQDVVTLWVTVGNQQPFDTGYRFYWIDYTLLQCWESVTISRSTTRRLKPA